MATPHDLLERLLSPAEARITIPASPEDVFAVLTDPTWLASEVADDSRPLVSDPPHRLQLEVHVGPAKGIVDFELVPTGAGTEVRFQESAAGRLGFAMPLLRGLIHLRNKASLDRLKQRFMPLVISL